MRKITEGQERNLGIKIARREGLNKTAEVIKNYGCYREIFNTLYNEAGEIKSLELIRESNEPRWAFKFACVFAYISRETKEALARVVIKSKNPYLAYCFVYNVSDISDETKEKLRAIYIQAR